MRRLPGILLLTGATLVVIVALLVSGLRLVLPHLDSWRPEILAKIQAQTGIVVDASHLNASWENFGPILDVRDVKATLKDGGDLSVKRVTLALDVWQSLLQMRWQFRDLTFYQLAVRTNTPLQRNDDGNAIETDRIRDLFLRQFDHFDLRDSRLSFLTLSGQLFSLHKAVERHQMFNDSGIINTVVKLRDNTQQMANGAAELRHRLLCRNTLVFYLFT